MKWLLQFLMRRFLLKNFGKRCRTTSWEDFPGEDARCPNCVAWDAYYWMFYPYDDGPKDAKFEAHFKSLIRTDEDYEEFDKED